MSVHMKTKRKEGKHGITDLQGNGNGGQERMVLP